MSDPLSDLIVTKVVSAVRLQHSPVGTVITRKNRNRWGISLKTKGRTVYTSGGGKVLSDARHPVILPAGSSYSWICTDPGECLMIEFDAAPGGLPLASFEVFDPSFIKNAFFRLEKALRLPGPGSEAEGKSIVYAVLAELLRTTASDYAPRSREARLRPALDAMEERFFDPALSNEALAALCGVSTAYFRKRFREAFGVSPIRYLHDLRMERAKIILQSDYGSISDVAESVGYNGIYHFSKMFRIYTGISPTEYARRFARAAP